MKKRLPIVAVSIAFLLAACAKSPPRTAEAVGVSTPEALRITQRIERLREASRDVSGLVWVQLVTSEEDRRTDAALAIKRPNLIRIDAMDNVADVWAQAGSDGETIWLFLPGKEKLYTGRASARTLKRLVDFSWEPWELISFIAGTPPLAPGAALTQVGPAKDRHFVATESHVHLFLEPGKDRISRCVRYAADGDGVDYEIRFSDYRRVGKLEFPYRLEASFPARGARMVVEYRDLELGKGASESAYQAPSGRAGKRVELTNER